MIDPIDAGSIDLMGQNPLIEGFNVLRVRTPNNRKSPSLKLARPRDIDFFRFERYSGGPRKGGTCTAGHDTTNCGDRRSTQKISKVAHDSVGEAKAYGLGIMIAYTSFWAKSTAPEPEMRRLILPFNSLSRKSLNWDSDSDTAGSGCSGFCGG